MQSTLVTLEKLLQSCTRSPETRNVHGAQLLIAKQNQKHNLNTHKLWRINTTVHSNEANALQSHNIYKAQKKSKPKNLQIHVMKLFFRKPRE